MVAHFLGDEMNRKCGIFDYRVVRLSTEFIAFLTASACRVTCYQPTILTDILEHAQHSCFYKSRGFRNCTLSFIIY